MMIFLLMFFSVSAFAQVSDNITPYVGSDYIGLQANPILTGVKSSVKNQETEFNITLFYHDKYDLKDDEIVGMVEGRLISEKAISSFDLIEQLQKDEQELLFNIENQQKAYIEYLEKFREYQQLQHSITDAETSVNVNVNVNANKRVTNITHRISADNRGRASITHVVNTNAKRITTNKNIIHIVSIDRRGNTNISHAVIDDKGQTNVIPIVNTNDVIHRVEIDENGVTNVIHEIDADKISLSYMTQKFVAQSFTNTRSLISDEELEQLIYIEQLKQEYQHLVELYNDMVATQQAIVENTFDPADPSERFVITIMGEDNVSTVWSKSFSLNGVDNYQSYDKSVWFLGYRLLITKKDVRMLYNIFTQNKKVKYMVTGVNGTIDFSLSSYFINAIKELMTVYAHGKLKTDSVVSFPLLRE